MHKFTKITLSSVIALGTVLGAGYPTETIHSNEAHATQTQLSNTQLENIVRQYFKQRHIETDNSFGIKVVKNPSLYTDLPKGYVPVIYAERGANSSAAVYVNKTTGKIIDRNTHNIGNYDKNRPLSNAELVNIAKQYFNVHQIKLNKSVGVKVDKETFLYNDLPKGYIPVMYGEQGVNGLSAIYINKTTGKIIDHNIHNSSNFNHKRQLSDVEIMSVAKQYFNSHSIQIENSMGLKVDKNVSRYSDLPKGYVPVVYAEQGSNGASVIYVNKTTGKVIDHNTHNVGHYGNKK
ncbi:hypothetical protein [Staphylococcus sp. Marseille-Q1834]|uniref:hypothetical protein n=1 Tax=Staphylococcus sp. Marseille-Q1834 TaxID=2866594 RepID=UPI0012B89033|nr:hypothetical protein [Staphylococcus sp. Marseille-Q1834]